MARAAGVKQLVLSHFVPSNDPTVTDQTWLEGARHAVQRRGDPWQRSVGTLTLANPDGETNDRGARAGGALKTRGGRATSALGLTLGDSRLTLGPAGTTHP